MTQETAVWPPEIRLSKGKDLVAGLSKRSFDRPIVYRDVVLPGLHAQLLACEPAQNLVHRALVRRDGAQLTLHRPPNEQEAENRPRKFLGEILVDQATAKG